MANAATAPVKICGKLCRKLWEKSAKSLKLRAQAGLRWWLALAIFTARAGQFNVDFYRFSLAGRFLRRVG